MAAGYKTLTKLKEDLSVYDHIETLGKKLEDGVYELSKKYGVHVVLNRVGGMMTIFFTDGDKIDCYDDVKKCDEKRFKRYFLHMLDAGFNLPPSQFEALFLSTKHTTNHIDKFLEAFEEFLKKESK